MKFLRRHKSLNQRPEETTQTWINRIIDSQYPDATPEERQVLEHRAVMRLLRANLAFFGADVSSMTDDEIEAGVQRLGSMVASTGITVQEASEAFLSAARMRCSIETDDGHALSIGEIKSAP